MMSLGFRVRQPHMMSIGFSLGFRVRTPHMMSVGPGFRVQKSTHDEFRVAHT